MKYPAKYDGDRAVSKREGYPLTGLPRGNENDLNDPLDTAMRRCKNNGPNYRLMSNTQWQTIARNAESVAANWTGGVVGSGKLYLGHTDNFPTGALNHSTDNDPYYGTANDANDGSEQKRIKFLTNDEIIWDFGGNVWQMVSGSYSIIKPSPSLPENVSVTFSDPLFFALTHILNRMLFAPLGEYDRQGHNTGDILIETETNTYGNNTLQLDVIQRGGSYDSNPIMGGMYATHAAVHKPLGQNSGFRCAYLP